MSRRSVFVPQKPQQGIVTDAERLEESLTSFAKQLNQSVVILTTQIEQTKVNLARAVQTNIHHAIPTTLPDALVDLLNLQTQLYAVEVEKVIKEQTDLLSNFAVAHPERVEPPPQAQVKLYDEGRGLAIFEEALDVTNQLLAALSDSVGDSKD